MFIQELLKKSVVVGWSEDIEKYFLHFYKFDVFRNILNFSFSLIEELRLFYKVYYRKKDMISSNADEDGECKVLYSNKGNFTKKQYIISINNLTPYVLIHELSHMVEKELEIKLQENFLSIIYEDLKHLKESNLLVRRLVDKIIFYEIRFYEGIDIRCSELFARYFELYAWTQEMYPKDREYMIHLKDIDKIFFKTKQWVDKYLNPLLLERTHNNIKLYSIKNPTKNLSTDKSWTRKFNEFNYKNIKSKFNN